MNVMQGTRQLPLESLPFADFLAESLARVRETFDRQLESDLPPVATLAGHVERYRGKMLRPMLVIICGLAAHPRAGDDPESLITREHIGIGAVCEMVHMATLVHDDILDDAQTRRRGATVNYLHGNETAVILGDYLIASAYHLCASQAPAASALIARASVVLCEGELLQLHHRNDMSLDEPTYFEIIRRKTGELIAISARLGAMASGAEDRAVDAVATYAYALGAAFQIQDDLLDLTGAESVVGKTVGRDMAKGKLTLPLIHHLGVARPTHRGRTLRLLENAMGGDHDSQVAIRELLEATGSVRYAQDRARTLVSEAKEALRPLRGSGARAALDTMADMVVERSY